MIFRWSAVLEEENGEGSIVRKRKRVERSWRRTSLLLPERERSWRRNKTLADEVEQASKKWRPMG